MSHDRIKTSIFLRRQWTLNATDRTYEQKFISGGRSHNDGARNFCITVEDGEVRSHVPENTCILMTYWGFPQRHRNLSLELCAILCWWETWKFSSWYRFEGKLENHELNCSKRDGKWTEKSTQLDIFTSNKRSEAPRKFDKFPAIRNPFLPNVPQ